MYYVSMDAPDIQLIYSKSRIKMHLWTLRDISFCSPAKKNNGIRAFSITVL